MLARVLTVLLLPVTFAYAAADLYDYKVLATTKTSTMEKELKQVGAAGYAIMAVTVAKTAFGGKELVAILRRAE